MNIAIISGASSGMGKEFDLKADQRYNLDEIWVIARRKERLVALQEGVKAKRIAAKLRASLEKSAKARKTQKLHEQAQARRNQLERTPSQDWFNFEHEEDGYFTETLAKIYIKQQRYTKALEIIRRLSLKYPKKNAYFADQIRFLEKLVQNSNDK